MEARTATGTHRPLTVVALMLAMAMAAMEMTIVSTAMPTVVGELGGLHLYAWVASVYLLTSTVTVPLYGKISDLFGRKPVILFGIGLFLAGSVACALAQTMPVLIVARAFQGLGAGAMQPMAITLIGDLFSLRERARIQPWMGAVWGVAGLAGPMLGGFLVKTLSWHYCFWINLPFGLASMAVITFALREDVKKKNVSLDWAGAAMLTVAVVSLLLGTEGVARGPLLALCVASVIAFVWIERRVADPVVPLDLFTSRVIGTGNLLTAILGGIMIAVSTYVPLYVQGIAHGTPTQAGGAITPMVVGWPIAAYVASRLIPKYGFRPFIVVGLTLTGVSAALLPFVARPGVDPWTLRALSCVMGTGMGSANTALLLVVQTTVPWERRGSATASNMFSRTIGSTIAVGAMGALLSNVVRGEADVPPEAIQAILLGKVQLAGAEGTRVIAALTKALDYVFGADAALGVFGIIAAMFFPTVAVDEKRPVAPSDPQLAKASPPVADVVADP